MSGERELGIGRKSERGGEEGGGEGGTWWPACLPACLAGEQRKYVKHDQGPLQARRRLDTRRPDRCAPSGRTRSVLAHGCGCGYVTAGSSAATTIATEASPLLQSKSYPSTSFGLWTTIWVAISASFICIFVIVTTTYGTRPRWDSWWPFQAWPRPSVSYVKSRLADDRPCPGPPQNSSRTKKEEALWYRCRP